MKKITRNTVVTLAYTLVDVDGNMVDEGREPLSYLHGGYNSIFLPVEVALHGKAIGDSVAVKLQPADAFGEYDPELVHIVPVDQLPQPLTVGILRESVLLEQLRRPRAGARDERAPQEGRGSPRATR